MAMKRFIILTTMVLACIQLQAQKLEPYFDKNANKYGFQDSLGNIAISPRYDNAYAFSDNLGIVELNGKYGYVNSKGVEVIPATFDKAESFEEGLAPVKMNGKWGYINKTGKPIIPNKYDEGGLFDSGVAVVKINNKSLLIDKTGKALTQPKYSLIDLFSDGLALVAIGGRLNDEGVFGGGKYGYINRMGVEVVPVKYDDAEPFQSGLAKVNLAGKWGLIDKQGMIKLPFKYDYIGERSSVSGAALINIGGSQPSSDDNKTTYSGGKWGVIDSIGEIVIPLKYNEVYASNSYDLKLPYIVVVKNAAGLSRSGLVNLKGIEITAPTFDSITWIDFNSRYYFVFQHDKMGLLNADGKLILIGADIGWVTEDGLICLNNYEEDGELFGCIDSTGKLVIPYLYQEIQYPSQGLMVAQKDSKFGLIDYSGKEIVPFVCENYNDINVSNEGLIGVKKMGKWGFLDLKGREIIPSVYESTNIPAEGFIAVKKDGKWGYLDYKGNEVIPFLYNHAESFINGFAKVRINSQDFLINGKGQTFDKNKNPISIPSDTNKPASDDSWLDLL